MAVFTGTNLRRAATLWSWVALLGAPFLLVIGILLVVGSGPGAPPPVEMRSTGAAGDAVQLLPGGRDAAVWGRPAGTGATCTTARSSGEPVTELPRGTGDRPVRVDDAGGSGSWELLGVTAGTGAAATVTCVGAGLEEVAVSPDPVGGRSQGFGLVVLVLAPVLLVLGLLTRRALRATA